MKVVAIVSRDLEKGSTKFRLAQYLPWLESKGVEVDFVRRNTIGSGELEQLAAADVIFNQKCLLPKRVSSQIFSFGRRVIFDFDDAIYTRPGAPFSWLTKQRVLGRLRHWLGEADLVTPANGFLGRFARKYSKRVEVVPMALDLNAWTPTAGHDEACVRIGWAGAPVNVHLLERLDPVLQAVQHKYPQVRFAFFSGQKPELKVAFDYHPFVSGGEAEFIRSLDIGLLPLEYEEYTLGKSPIKAIQYLACGVPAVGNILGATEEILTPDNSLAVSQEEDWLPALEQLIIDRPRARAMGLAGRQHAELHFSRELISRQLYTCLTG